MHTSNDESVDFDPTKALENFRKHGVRFTHAEEALCDPQAATRVDPDCAGELRLVSLGLDSLGRVLLVVHTEREGRTRLISARKASATERAYYDAR